MGCLRFLRALSGICLHNVRKDTVSVSSRIPDVGIADNYDHPIYEAGKQLKDMVYLKQNMDE